MGNRASNQDWDYIIDCNGALEPQDPGPAASDICHRGLLAGHKSGGGLQLRYPTHSGGQLLCLSRPGPGEP